MYKVKKFRSVGMGGTFDRLHRGHKDFIRFAASLAEKLFIGVTEEKLVKGKQYEELILPYSVRANAVRTFCKKENINCHILPLADPFGPTIESKEIKALAVTTATEEGGAAINNLRSKLGMSILPINVFTLTKDDSGEVITSTRLRAGEINRHGEIFSNIFSKDLTLSSQQRKFFSKPQGEIVFEPSPTLPHQKTIVVGDISLAMFRDNNWKFDLGVYDGKTTRDTKITEKHPNDILVTNKAGLITKELADILQKWKSKPFKYLFVEGEEDLATVAAAILMPLGTRIYYGQPEQGLVELEVDEKLKQKFFEVLTSSS